MNRVVVFDLDDTLIPSTRIYEIVLKKLNEVSAAEFNEARGKVKEFLPKEHVAARNRLLYLKAFSEKSGKFDPMSILALQQKYEELLATEIERFWFSSNRDELLGKLATVYDLYILTNENLRTQLIKLSALGTRFSSCIKGLLTSEEAGIEKPSLTVFYKFISRFGLSNCPAEAITMVGDNFEHDILPARAIGWSAIQSTEFVDSPSSDLLNSGNHKFSSLSAIVQELLKRG